MNRIIITIISLLSLAIVALPAYAESTRKERRLISEGNRLYKEGKFKEASKQYQMAVAVNPQSPEARFNLALSHLKLAAQPGVDEKQREQLMKSGTEGMSAIAGAGASNPKLASYAAYNLGNVAFNAQQYPEAIQCYKQALRFNPDDDTARRNLRIAQKKLQDQNKDQNKDKDKDKDKDNKDKDQNNQNKDQNQNKDKNENQQKDNSMSNNTAEQILKAMENKENATRTRVNAAGQGKEAAGKNGGRKNW